MMKLAILVVTFFFANCAFAQVVFDTGIFVESDGRGSADSGTAETTLVTNFNFDLAILGKFFVGGKLLLGAQKTTAAGATPVLTTYFAPGVNVGFGASDQGVRCALFATLSPTEESSGDFEYAVYGGIGYGVEASYLIRAGTFALGPKLTYLVDRYAKENVGGTYAKLEEPAVRTRLVPQVALVKTL